MNAHQRALRYAAERGYSVAADGAVLGPSGASLATRVCRKGYRAFLVHTVELGRINVHAHRLVAFRKFGDRVFEPGMQVRHLDGNRLNNDPSNIEIGTAHDNRMDVPAPERLRQARGAARVLRKLTSSEVAELRSRRADGATYGELVRDFGIAKSTVSYICRARTYRAELGLGRR